MMIKNAFTLPPALFLLLATACGGGGDGSVGTSTAGAMSTAAGGNNGGMQALGGGGAGTGTGVASMPQGGGATGNTANAGNATCGLAPDADGNLLIMASEANNYSFSSTLTIDATHVAPGQELTFDWSGVTADFQGHPVDPTMDIDAVSLLVWSVNHDDLQTKLNADALAQSDLVVPSVIYTEPEDEAGNPTGGPHITSGTLFDCTSFGMPIEQDVLLGYLNYADYPPETHAYTLMAATGTVLGKNTRMIQAFVLDENTENTHVVMNSESTKLDFTADLHSLQPTVIPAGTANLAIDWSNLTTNALGHTFDKPITDALVAHYTQTPQELEEKFLDLELIAQSMYRGEVLFGTSLALSDLTDEAGNPFPGIDNTGTWIVALFCGDCSNPAPWYISVLTACSQ